MSDLFFSCKCCEVYELYDVEETIDNAVLSLLECHSFPVAG